MDILSIILFIAGFPILIKGADILVEGSSAIARRLGLPDLIIGLTIVAFGTSMPELIVNLFASAESSELAISNVIGSNIANILLVLGVAALIRPLTVHRLTVYREILFNIAAAGMLGVLVAERFLSEGGFKGLDHIDGIILLSYFAIFLYYTFGKNIGSGKEEEEIALHPPSINIGKAMIAITVGVIGLWLGGQWIVNGAIEIARDLGVSDALIGLTVVAVGTSLPELATSVVAARKGNVDIAVGNAVGSNLFNILWILGIGSALRPIGFADNLVTDIIINFVVAIVLFGSMAFGKYKHQISKPEAHVFISLYVAYIIFVVVRG